MAKYKLSESMMDSFWGLFGQKRKPEKIEKLINNDPVLKKLDGEIQALAGSFRPRLLDIKKNRPEDWKNLVDAGLVPKDYK
jgi:hypothetical protein